MLGRWTTVYPIRAGLNWYVNVGNDPVNRIDPLGLLLDNPLYSISHLNDPAYMAEKIGDLATYGALGLNVANLGATITGNIPAAETFGIVAGVLDMTALGAYVIAGNPNKAGFAIASVVIDIIPGIAVPIKPAYNPVARRFISASTGRFIKRWAGVAKYSLLLTINTGIRCYEILDLETGESNK